MTNYALNDEKMFADVTDGIAIIINSETGIYYGLNGLGTIVYENLVNGATIEAISAKLKELAGDSVDIDGNLKLFIDTLLEKELIIEAPATNAEVTIDETIAKEDDFIMTAKEYNDAQELLLADPIHEVKEETGWTPEKDSIGYTKEETIQREEKVENA